MTTTALGDGPITGITVVDMTVRSRVHTPQVLAAADLLIAAVFDD